MIRFLTNRICIGTFEAHITVEANKPAERERFRATCSELCVKAVLIELPSGKTPNQPMTSSYHRGTVQKAAEEVATVAQKLRATGFSITRVKLEAVATNEGIPETDAEALSFPPGCYFEFHVKLSLPLSADLTALRSICDQFAAKLSRNAFKQQPGGVSERFVNMRLYKIGRTTAFQRLEELQNTLMAAGFEVINRQREYALFDSHIDLDAGWLENSPTESS
ncbi:MAG TPA: hypothetical protein VG122_02565 [Gemmata sp.]|jgi:hypothetical protein|nr:hypothetical protein [Gemmata sp.]